MTVENKGKLILTEIFSSVQKHDISFLILSAFLSPLTYFTNDYMCSFFFLVHNSELHVRVEAEMTL